MRWRSFQVTFAALTLLLGTSAASRAQNDGFFAENDAPETVPSASAATAKAPIDPTADRLPTGSLTPPKTAAGLSPLAPAASPVDGAGATQAGAKPKMAEKSLDPEPDAIVVPPTATSVDPLDALAAPAAKPADGKAGAAKLDTPKSGPVEAKPGQPNGAADPAPQRAQEALPGLNAAIKAALDKRETAPLKGAYVGERRKERKAIAFLYAAHGFAPIWSADGTPAAAAAPILERLAHAADDGLSLPQAPTDLKSSGAPDAVADSDIALTEAVVAYARQATGSRVDPSAISPLIGVKRSLADPAAIIDALAAAGSAAGDKLQALNPSEPRYVALREKLVELRSAHTADRNAVQGGSIPVVGPTLRIGMHDKRVPLIRARLGLGGALGGDDREYDGEVADAVAAFQRDNGLNASGSLTKRTIEALSVQRGGVGRSPKLEAKILANMEMWRWMPRELGADRIEVNVPDYAVTVFHDGQPVSHNKVVVGKLDTPTPLFSNTMKYLIVNPYWNVPQSIIRNELLPKGGGSLSYLNGRGYSVSTANGMPVVKQLPGDKNALGRIKFLFPNDYSVYLHDTPSKSLFAASKRAFSHGCVRVDKPFAFAQSVLNDTPIEQRKAWSQDRLEDMIGDKERYVNLPAPLPIHIEYFTATVDGAGGEVKLRDDVYGYANAVAAALNLDSETLPIAGRVKPAPLLAQATERPRRRSIATAASPESAPVASRSFWDIFDPR